MTNIITLGIAVNDYRQEKRMVTMKLEKLIDMILLHNIKFIVDVATFSSSDEKPYNETSLRKAFKSHNISYISKRSEIKSTLKQLSEIDPKDKELRKTNFRKYFSDNILDLVDGIATEGSIGIMFNTFELVGPKMSFSYYLFKEKHLNIGHMHPKIIRVRRGQLTKEEVDIFSSYNIFTEGYGSLLNVKSDMFERYRQENPNWEQEFNDDVISDQEQYNSVCEICGGDSSTGCLYFDPTECPRIN